MLLFASRPAYLAGRLVEVAAPSINRRAVVTLYPPLSLIDGRVELRLEVTSLPGLPPVHGLGVEALRRTLAPLGVRASAALARALPRGQELLLVEAIDGVPVADPSAL